MPKNQNDWSNRSSPISPLELFQGIVWYQEAKMGDLRSLNYWRRGINWRRGLIWKGSSDAQTLGVQPGLGTQPHYEAPCDLWIQHRQNTVINTEWVRLFPQYTPFYTIWIKNSFLKKKLREICIILNSFYSEPCHLSKI